MSWATVVRGEGDASALPTQQTSDGRSSVILASGTVDLLLEASKSRSSVRGERRCLACGKAFTEVGRLAQHLRDVHGGVNTPVNDSYPTQQRPGGRGSAPLTLGDVAVVRKSVVTAWQTPEPRRQQQRQGPAPERLQQALAPPPGTRARQRKQQSRLKRGFLRARAAAAVERWWTTLSELEGAMQATREAAAVLHNRTALLRAALESEHAAPAGHLAASAARVADMGVHLQLLDRQAVDAAENMAGLAAAHAHARERLAAAQEAALQFERLAVAEPATAPVPTSDPGDKNYYNGAEKKLEVCGEPPAAEQEAAACSTGPTLPMAVVTAAVHAQQPSPVPALHHEPPSDCAATEADSYSSLGWDNALSRWMPPALQTLDQQRKDAARAAPAVQPATAVIGPALPATAPPRSNSSSEQDVVAAGKEAAEGSSGGGDSGGSSEGSSLELGWTNTLAEWARGRRSEALTVMQAYATGGVLEAAAPDPPLPGNTVDLHGGQRRPSPFSTCAAAGVPTDKGAASDPPVSYAELSSRAVSSEGDEEISLLGDSPVKAHSIMHGSIDSGHRGSADGLSLLPFHAQASNRSAGFGSELSLRSLQHSSSDQQGQQPTGAGISVREWLSASEEAAAAAAAYIASSSKRSLHASLLVHPALGSGAQAPPASAQSRHAVAKAPAASLCQGLCASEAPPPADCGCAINENDSTPSQHASTPHTQAEDSASQPSAHTHDDRISVADWASEDGRQLPISPPAFVPITLGAVAAAAPVGAYLGGLPPGHSIATDGTVGLPFAPVAFFVRHGDRPGSFVCCLCNVKLSGPRCLQEHLLSQRHKRRVQALAGGLLPSAEASGAVALAAASAPPPMPDTSGPDCSSGGSRTYTGPNADVEPYVDQIITSELNAVAEALLRRLHDWQERTRATNPHNARRKRRLVSGLREVDKAVRGRKAQALLLAPNVGPIAPTFETPESGSDDNKGVAQESPITALLALAAEREVPVVFCLSRQRMGRIFGQGKKASAFAILDAQGAGEQLAELLTLAEQGRRQWHALREPL